jgi:hypothetical protein
MEEGLYDLQILELVYFAVHAASELKNPFSCIRIHTDYNVVACEDGHMVAHLVLHYKARRLWFDSQ